ncbi:MerC domain-containing protein [Wenzhouxiangella sp. EGI_FJ10409]|uniref:MerC domain-containing protein n=1 Tax=Wenzhouxiangella sp. EGI_FJ10409 TaxID=3243767 RepID=UPI0035E08467
MRFRLSTDRIGLFVAIGCGLHCAALSGAFLLWPALWLNRRLWESGLWHSLRYLELGLLALAWTLVIFASWLGWRHHRCLHPAVIGLTGAMVMTVAIVTPLHFSGFWVSVMALLGGLTVAAAHWLNLRLYRRLHQRGA